MNLYKKLLGLLPARPLQIGLVVGYADGVSTITLPDDSLAQARGDAAIGDRVFFRDDVIEGIAPALPYLEVEI